MTRDSIAFAVGRSAPRSSGAEVVLTGFGRARRLTERAARAPAEHARRARARRQRAGRPRAPCARRWTSAGAASTASLHAIAFAPPDALGGNFLATPPESAETAFRTSAYSLKALAEAVCRRCCAEGGGSLVGLDFDASVAWPAYDWMGVSKAALEAVSRYLARDLGPQGVRVNLVSAGPLQTLAACGIPGFDDLAGTWERQAPLGWDVRDPAPGRRRRVLPAVRLARARITGEIVHVDGGFHAVGAPA